MHERIRQTLKASIWFVLLVFLTAAVGVDQAAGRGNETALRRNLAWQAALEAVGFSPGLIDGRVGAKTVLATQEFQRVRGLPRTGKLDQATADALKIDPDNVIVRYTVGAEDLQEIGPAPKGWLAKSRLARLGHEDLTDVLAERFHCARHLLGTLNPGTNINRLKPGEQVVVPNLGESYSPVRAQRIEISLGEKLIRALDRENRLVALFHCSIAADKAKAPSGQARVVCAVPDPHYTFDPKMWPEVKEKITQKLDIPPGPRNPVGRFWTGLSLPGYGIHGTPNPELIGKTGSHGCFRMTNWDAVRLGRMVRVGTEVSFVRSAGPLMASASR